MSLFKKIVSVSEEDLDELQHVNNVRYLQWVQDISKEHWQSKVPQEVKEKVIWVVVNHNISYKIPAKLNQMIRVETYIAKTRGAISVRIVDMYNNETNQLLVHSETQWCLLNAQTQKPMRIPGEIALMFK